MSAWIDNILVMLILLNLLLVASRGLVQCVNALAVEGALLAALPLLVEWHTAPVRAAFFSLAILSLRSFVIPLLLKRAIGSAGIQNDIHPFLGHTASVVIVTLGFIGARMLNARLQWPVAEVSSFMAPVAFLCIFTGFFLIVSRRQAVSQVIGYLQLEYGIFIFGMAHPYEHSIFVEIAVLLDLLVAVMVMGIAIYHINREFDHIDTDKLSVLRDFMR